MANAWLNPLSTLCIISVMLRLGVGERFFQYRDHRDQRMYEQEAAVMSVHNKLEAEVGILLICYCIVVVPCSCSHYKIQNLFIIICQHIKPYYGRTSNYPTFLLIQIR